jgi:hypothetical protein
MSLFCNLMAPITVQFFEIVYLCLHKRPRIQRQNETPLTCCSKKPSPANLFEVLAPITVFSRSHLLQMQEHGEQYSCMAAERHERSVPVKVPVTLSQMAIYGNFLGCSELLLLLTSCSVH